MFPIVVLSVVKQRLNAWLNERPSTSVKWLFLAIDKRLSVGVRVQVLLQLLPWEWMDLLDSRDGGGGVSGVLSVLVERREDLAGAHDDTLDFVVGLDLTSLVGLIWDDPLEVRVASELFNR